MTSSFLSFISSLLSGICRYPNQCQECAGTLTSLRDMQVSCRYPNQCQECAGTLTGIRDMHTPWPVPGVSMN